MFNNKYKTSLCKLYEATGSCNFGAKCSFAHGSHELRRTEDPIPREAMNERNDRVPYSNYKTIKCCYFYKDGICPFGIRCSYAHGDFELRSKYDPIFPPIDCYPPIPSHLFFPYYCSEPLENLAFFGMQNTGMEVEPGFPMHESLVLEDLCSFDQEGELELRVKDEP